MASWITPSVQAVGDILTAAIWNQNVVDNTTFLAQAPYARTNYSGSTSVPTATPTAVPFSTLLYSNYGFTVVSHNLIVPLPGVYAIAAAGALAHNGDTGLVEVAITQNASLMGTSIGWISETTGTVGISLAVSDVIKCAAGDAIGLTIEQFTGATTTMEGTDTFLSIVYQGLT